MIKRIANKKQEKQLQDDLSVWLSALFTVAIEETDSLETLPDNSRFFWASASLSFLFRSSLNLKLYKIQLKYIDS